MCVCALSHFSHVWLFVTTWTVAHEAPLSMGISRKEYWNGLPCLPPGDLPSPGIEPTSFMSPAWVGEFIGRWVPPGPTCRFQNYLLLPIMWANSLKYLSNIHLSTHILLVQFLWRTLTIIPNKIETQQCLPHLPISVSELPVNASWSTLTRNIEDCGIHTHAEYNSCSYWLEVIGLFLKHWNE